MNILGGFIMGFIMEASTSIWPISANMRIFLTTGMMGGLTTFSTFSYETLYKAFMRQPAGAVSISRHVKIYYKKMAYAHY